MVSKLLILAALALIPLLQPSQAQFWEGANNGLNQQLNSRKPRAQEFFVELGVYEARVTSDGMNRYAMFNGGPRIRTRLCFHSVDADDVVLNIESVRGFNIGTITFSDGTQCPVSRLE